jgi:hypothetical protein
MGKLYVGIDIAKDRSSAKEQVQGVRVVYCNLMKFQVKDNGGMKAWVMIISRRNTSYHQIVQGCFFL